MAMGDADFHATAPYGAPRPVVRFGAIGEAWELILAQLGVWIPTVLVAIAGNWLVGGLVFSILRVRIPGGPGAFRFGVPEGPAAVQVVLGSIVTGFFLCGMFRMACRQVRGAPIGVMDLFTVIDVLPEYVLGTTLYAAAVFIASWLCFLPALVVLGLLMFTLPLIVDGHLKATDAIARSFHTLKHEWSTATLFHFVVSALCGIGTCLCCVGLLFTAPLYVLSISILYRDALLAKGVGFKDKPAPPDPEF